MLLKAETINRKIGKIRDVEGMKNVEKMASGKRYLACQLGSRVGILKSVMPDFGFQEVSKISKKFPKSMVIEVAGFTEYLKPYGKSSPRSYVTVSASTWVTTNRLRRSLTRLVGNQIPCSELVHCLQLRN